MSERRRLSRVGKACAIAAASLLASALLFGHPFPALAGGMLVGVLLLGSLGGRSLAKLRFVALPPARLVEDEERLLEIGYQLAGRFAPIGVVLSAHGPAVELAGGTPALLPSLHGRLPLRVHALKRGRYERLLFEVEVRGAFAVRDRAQSYDVATDLWVLPRPRALRERVLEEMLALRPRGSERPQPTGPGEGEFYALRDWRLGDSERRVHPRLSARRGKKVMRIFRGEAPPLVELVVDLRVPRGARTFGQLDFDEAMRFAAGIVQSLLKRAVPVSLTLVEAGGPRLACDRRCRDLHAFLGALAVARSVPGNEAPTALRLAGNATSGRRVVLHLGQVDEAKLPPSWVAIQVGSRRYYQLLDMNLGPVDRPVTTGAADGS